MPRFKSLIFVCCNTRERGHSRGCCNPDASDALRNSFQAEIKRRGLAPLVRASKSGCLEQCELGPTVVIYPQDIWYGHVQVADVSRIIEETVLKGRVLEDLLIPDDWLNTGGRGPGGMLPKS
jgi:(2Fe-2S) ferredoxin